MKIVYMGTPDFAVEPLKKLVENGYEVVLVVTQPDKEKGRGKEISMSPVKECALQYGIPVFQPDKIRTPENVEELRKYDADIFIVAAFGQIVSEEILNMPRFGCINIHASLLPKYRGAAPIQWCILNGEEKTGVTIMQMAKGVDTGDIIAMESIDIEADDTGDSLFDKLMYLGAELLIKTLPSIEDGSAKRIPQVEEESTHVGKITKDMGLIDWTKDAEYIERYVRGLNSWPSAFTKYNGKTLKIWKADILDEIELTAGNSQNAGEIAMLTKDAIVVKAGNGYLSLKEVQLEGKKRMSVHDFLLGVHMNVGDALG